MRIDTNVLRNYQSLPAITLKKKPRGEGRLIFRPHKQHRMAAGGQVPALLAQGSNGNWTDLPMNEARFDGQKIDRKLAKSLCKGGLLGWGAVPSDNSSGKRKPYRDGWIWIAEQRSGSVRTLYITERKRTGTAGARGGYSIAMQFDNVMTTEWNSGDSSVETRLTIGIKSNPFVMLEDLGINKIYPPSAPRKGDQVSSLLNSTFADAGTWEIWDTCWPVIDPYIAGAIPPRFSGTKIMDATGEVIVENERFTPMGIPAGGSGSGGSGSSGSGTTSLNPNFGLGVENSIKYYGGNMLTAAGDVADAASFITLGIAVTLGLLAAGLALSSSPASAAAPDFAFAGASFGFVSFLLAALEKVMRGLDWLNNNLIAPMAGWAAQEAFDYFNPPPGAPAPNPSTPPATTPNILDSLPDMEGSGAGMSELWEFMNENLSEEEDEFVLEWSGGGGGKGSPRPRPDPGPDPQPEPEPEADPEPEPEPEPNPTPNPDPTPGPGQPPPNSIRDLPSGTPILVTVLP